MFSALRQIFETVNPQVEAAQPIRFSVGDEVQAACSNLADATRATVLLRLRFKTEELGTFGVRDQDVRIGEENELFAMTNAFLLALDQVMFRMDEKDARITLGTLDGKTQTAIGEELEIGQSTISKRFKNNGAATILTILDTLGHTYS